MTDFKKQNIYVCTKKKQLAFDNLKVCWVNSDKRFNCSKCEKCMRTIVSIGIVDEEYLKKLKIFIIDKSFDEFKNIYFSANNQNFAIKEFKDELKKYLSE